MNYYERHIGDYLKDTAHLSLLEHGIYGRLLDIYYTREAAIPEAQVMRLVGARSPEECSAVRDVLNEFFTRDGDDWRHTRCDRELAKYQDKQRKAKASADARWSKDKPHIERNANAMRTHSEGNAPSNQTPVTKQIPSDADASGGEPPAPPPPKDVVFALGVPLLTASGVKESNARSFLAMQVKAHGDAKTAEALQRCAEERPVEPVGWLQKHLGPIKTGGKAGKHAGFDRLDYHEGVTADGHLA